MILDVYVYSLASKIMRQLYLVSESRIIDCMKIYFLIPFTFNKFTIFLLVRYWYFVHWICVNDVAFIINKFT